MDFPPELREGIAREAPAIVGGGIGALLAAKGFWAKFGYLVFGYALGRYVGPLLDRWVTNLGGDVSAILAGAFGLLLFERLVLFIKGIEILKLSKTATERLQRLIGWGRR